MIKQEWDSLDQEQVIARWRDEGMPEHTIKGNMKFFAREPRIKYGEYLISSCLPECKKGGFSILDVSCGNGVFLELLRTYRNQIYGTEVDKKYEEMLKSQNIPWKQWDSTILPFPFPDNTFDIVTCIGSINFYKPYSLWGSIVKDFMRMGKKKVVVSIDTSSPKHYKEREYLNSLKENGWEIVESKPKYIFIWKGAEE